MGLYNDVLLIQTLYLVPFARYSTSKISVSDLDLSGPPKVKYFYFFRKPICDFVILFCWCELYLIPFARYSASKISVSDLDLSGSTKVKYFDFFRKLICDFIMVSCWYQLYLLPFARYYTSKISVSDLDLSGSTKVKYFTFSGKPIWDFIMTFCWYKLCLVPFARYLASKISFCDLDLSGSPKVKYFNFFGKPICIFIMVFCWYELSISYRLRDICRHTSDDLAANPTFDLKVIDLNWFLVSIDLLLALVNALQTRYISLMSVLLFHLCIHLFSSLEILNRAWNNMGKSSKYFSTLRSHISGIPWPNESNKCPLELYSLLYVCKKSARLLDIFDHLCDGQRTPMFGKKKNKKTKKRI